MIRESNEREPLLGQFAIVERSVFLLALNDLVVTWAETGDLLPK